MPIDVTLRTATERDRTAIYNLLSRVQLLTDDLLVPNSTYWVAELPGQEIIGCGGLEFGQNAALMRSIAVYPTYRGAGLGAQLTQHALSLAQSRGYTFVYCFSTRAGQYWKKYGFCQVPIDEIADVLHDTPQVQRFAAIGKLAVETAWRMTLMKSLGVSWKAHS